MEEQIKKLTGGTLKELIDKIADVLTSVQAIDKSLAVLRSDVDTKLTEVSGKMKGNFELIQRDISSLADKNDLQHESLKASLKTVEFRVDNAEKEIKENRDKDVNRQKDLEKVEDTLSRDMQGAVNSIRDAISGTGDRVTKVEEKMKVVWALISVLGMASITAFGYLFVYMLTHLPAGG